jgi:hypothetical protein
MKTSQMVTFGLYNGRVMGENSLGTINATRVGTPIFCAAGNPAV